MSSISIIIRTDKESKNGNVPIYYRITDNRRSKFIAAGINISSKYWDSKKMKVKVNHPNAERINSYLYTIQKELSTSIISNTLKNGIMNFEEVKVQLFKDGKINIFDYCNPIVQSYKAKGPLKSLGIEIAIGKLRDFAQKDILYFNEIDFVFVKNFERYLRNMKKNSGGTISRNFKYLRMIFKKAAIDKIIPYSSNPFLNYRIKIEKVQRQFLNEDEIKMISELELPLMSIEDKTKDLFIFACYCGGIRLSDLLVLKKANFDGTYISFTSQKTTTQQRIKVPSKAFEIICKYEHIKGSDFLFPFLENSINNEDKLEFYRAKGIITKQLNASLKAIIERLNIHKTITFHCSRHTFATRALTKGIALEKVSKLLGHASIMQTLEYAKIVNIQIDNAMDLFN